MIGLGSHHAKFMQPLMQPFVQLCCRYACTLILLTMVFDYAHPCGYPTGSIWCQFVLLYLLGSWTCRHPTHLMAPCCFVLMEPITTWFNQLWNWTSEWPNPWSARQWKPRNGLKALAVFAKDLSWTRHRPSPLVLPPVDICIYAWLVNAWGKRIS